MLTGLDALPLRRDWLKMFRRAAKGAVIDRAFASYATYAALTTQIPGDNTVPQNTEGTQVLSVSLTPKSTTNRVRVRFQGEFSTNASPGSAAAALFTSASASAIASTLVTSPTADYAQPIVLEWEYVPATTSPLTFSIRVGPISAITMKMNGTATSQFFNGTVAATLVVEEIAA